MTTQLYQGTELELFKHAINWKQYYAQRLRPFIVGHVLEVGAGIGGTTAHLCAGTEQSWTCLEPDPTLLETLRRDHPGDCVNGVPLRTEPGTVDDLPSSARFQTILYIDVLEHIEHDAHELETAVTHLVPGGHIVVLSPAHQFLYSEFDRAVGHFRRYTSRQLEQLTPNGTYMVRTEYPDSVGALLSLINRLLLRQQQPRAEQIALWDGYLLPISKTTDYALGRLFGRSVIAIWRRTSAGMAGTDD